MIIFEKYISFLYNSGQMSKTLISDAKRRLMERLKRVGSSRASELADSLGLTDVAVRQHLLALEESGIVQQEPTAPKGRGRPAVMWSLTEHAQSAFPERHAELAVGLIDATRRAVGEVGLQRIINARADDQIKRYRATLPAETAPLRERLELLARERSGEGYMAEIVPEAKDCYLLVEHHCPICDAAKCCVGLCNSELEVFRRVLGEDVAVERVEHVLSGGRRCAYRVQPRVEARERIDGERAAVDVPTAAPPGTPATRSRTDPGSTYGRDHLRGTARRGPG
jgi:predicted ArsR family transcriptional regulator